MAVDEIAMQEIGAAICLAITLASAVSCLLIQIAMVAGINSKVGPGQRLSWLSRDQLRISREHRRHFPQSRLRTAFAISLSMAMAGGIGFAFCLG
jgi:hypothetical protein